MSLPATRALGSESRCWQRGSFIIIISSSSSSSSSIIISIINQITVILKILSVVPLKSLPVPTWQKSVARWWAKQERLDLLLPSRCPYYCHDCSHEYECKHHHITTIISDCIVRDPDNRVTASGHGPSSVRTRAARAVIVGGVGGLGRGYAKALSMMSIRRSWPYCSNPFNNIIHIINIFKANHGHAIKADHSISLWHDNDWLSVARQWY